jgi:glycosyltransferase involved in cell wall biosynthesis
MSAATLDAIAPREISPPVQSAGLVQPRVSVVIPTYRRLEMLRRCLDAVCRSASRLGPGTVEVIVADDAADDETRRCVESFAVRDVAIRYLSVTGTHGPAAARNAGWRAARAEVIAFTDDDCLPQPGWLTAGLAPFSSPKVLGVSGRVVMPLRAGGQTTTAGACPCRPTDYELNATNLARAEFVTANCFYRREALEAVGGFDERFRMAWREDSDVFFSLLERSNGSAPSAFVSAPEAIVVHPIRPAGWGVSIAQQSRNRYNALLYKKHGRLYRERLAPVTPWHYYGIAAALVTASVGLAARRPALARLGTIAWLGLTGRFLARRLAGTSREPRHVVEMVVTSVLIPPVALYWRWRGAIEHRARFL